MVKMVKKKTKRNKELHICPELKWFKLPEKRGKKILLKL